MTTLTLQTRWAGLVLLVAGWVVLILAIVLLSSTAWRYVFVIIGLVIELIGLTMVGLHHRSEAGGQA